MSSLVTTASTWNNDDVSSKKRPSTMNMRKTVKMRPDNVGEVDYNGENEELKKMQPASIEESNDTLEERNLRVNQLLNKMTTSDSNDNKLGDFSPISPPSLNVKKDIGDYSTPVDYNPPPYSPPSYASNSSNKTVGNYSANNGGVANLSNYQRSYEPPQQLGSKPYYANMGIGKSNMASTDNKLMEKINYMIHLLEEHGHEKTNNITEEFILYTFLGVFIIFVVDSFARSGKYIR